ncbi:SH3 domain-containing protein [Lachnospiraceae bacterium 62-35]
MGNTGRTSSWDKIQRGVRDTERLMGQKQYNMAMVKARQTLEYMVRSLGEKACIVDGDLMTTIDALYKSRWITKSTCEHYHKIRTIGNKAVHDGNDNSYDANQAFQLLSQEIYIFADNYAAKRRRPPSESNSNPNRNSSRSRTRRRRRKKGIGPQDMIRILIPVLFIILLVVIIRFFAPKEKEEDNITSDPGTSIEQVTTPVTMPSATEPPSTAAPVYKATTDLNVRSDPSTNNPRIGLIAKDSVVEYIGDHDEQWAIINYNGQEAYIAKEYLTAE